MKSCNMKYIIPSIVIYGAFEIFLQLSLVNKLDFNIRLLLSNYAFVFVLIIILNSAYIIYKSILERKFYHTNYVILILILIRIIFMVKFVNPY